MVGRGAVLACLFCVQLAWLGAAQSGDDIIEPPEDGIKWDVACQDFVSGGLTAFFDGHLEDEELKCVSGEISEMVGDIAATIKELAQTITDAIIASAPTVEETTTQMTTAAYTTETSVAASTAASAAPTQTSGKREGSHQQGKNQHHKQRHAGKRKAGHHKKAKTAAAASTSTTTLAAETADQQTGSSIAATTSLAPEAASARRLVTYSPYPGEEVESSAAIAEVASTTLQVVEPPPSMQGTPLGLTMALEIPQLLGALSKITTLYQTLTGSCVKSDLKKDLEIASANLKNGSHIGNQIFINGANLTMDLNDAIADFRKEKFGDCGFNVGMILRKVVLETSETPASGPPNKEQIVQLTAGLLEGLAGGYVFEVREAGQTAALKLDFGECLAYNTKTLALLWHNIWDLARALNGNVTAPTDASSAEGLQVWQTLVSNLLVQLPEMLSSCGLTADVVAMLGDGSAAVRRSFDLALPQQRLAWDDIQVSLNAAVKKFEAQEWEDFGKYLGEVVQGFILIWIPDEYYKGVSGELRRFSLESKKVQNQSVGHSLVAPVLCVAMIASVLAFALRKQLASCRVTTRSSDWDAVDMEAATLVTLDDFSAEE